MNISRKILLGLTVLAAGIAIGLGIAQRFPGGAGKAGSAAESSPQTDRKVLYWYDPMVPTQKFDQPGKSPYMDMELVPKYADEDAQDNAGVRVSARTVQALGLRTAEAVQRLIGADLDVVGTVLLNDRDVSIVQARAAGFVERVYARAAGDVIAAGAPLADLLLPEWVAAQREFLAVRSLGDSSLTTASRQRLLLLGMPQALVNQVERTGEPRGVYTVTAPQGGLVAELMVRQGMTVTAGASLARVNGLATVWIEAAVPEAQSGPLQAGQEAQVRLAAFPGEVLKARIVSILPEANRDTRTVRVRLEMGNPGQRLKAGMSGQISLQGREQSALLVPSEAIIRTGRRALAYVVDGPGKFHPVEVRLGAEIGDQLVVQSGLEPGQQVVASAQFLIDSEASLRGAVPAGSIADANPAGTARPAASVPSAPAGQTFTVNGVVQKVSSDEVTLAHDAVPGLKWPAMTMGFKLANPQLSAGLAPQQRVRFTFSQQGDDYVITRIERSAP
ncbi:efflux RND transporter periplasmic adaptor subunit [Delftia deserti]|uniref:Efflux RND transporter periplasmic adaptor subunit n=1 Tax=Delftia deserti TaxID=1651218 RepID=A0ABW5EJI7_9BURK